MGRKKSKVLHSLMVAKAVLVLLISVTLVEVILMLSTKVGLVWEPNLHQFFMEYIMFILIILSVATLAIFLISKKVMAPYHDLKEAIYQVGQGNFSVSVDYEVADSFGELVKCFNQMVEELNGLDTMRSDFVNTFSHECKTPIVAIRGFARQLKRPDLSEVEREEYLDIIIKESERLSQLYQNILSLSRYQNQELVTNQELFPLDEQLRSIILLLEKQWSKKHLEIEAELEPVYYYGNEEMLHLVWTNIIGNAIKFSNDSGKLSVFCSSNYKGATVIVKDTGIGMDEYTKRHMFEKFFTTPTHEERGNGLGLLIVKRIVDICHGKIEVESELGKGTEIKVFLPKI